MVGRESITRELPPRTSEQDRHRARAARRLHRLGRAGHRPEGRLRRDRGPLRAGRRRPHGAGAGHHRGRRDHRPARSWWQGKPATHRQRRRSTRPLPHRLRVRGPQGRGPHPHPLGAPEHRPSPCGSRLQNAVRLDHDGAAEKARSEPMVERLDIKAPSLSTIVSSLSGGNQQKVSLAKWLTAGRGRPHHRRAHRGHRRPHQGQPARAHLGAGGSGAGRAAHLQRHARDGPPRRPHRGHARRSHRRRARQQPRLRRCQPADHGLHPVSRTVAPEHAKQSTGGTTCPSSRSRR